MKAINGTAFRKRQAEHLDECEQSNIPLLVITGKNGRDEPQQMIVIPKEEYDRMQNIIKGDK